MATKKTTDSTKKKAAKPASKKKTAVKKVLKRVIRRHESNPIIVPKENNSWESKATFNPAAMYAGDKVHLVYRAIGNDDVSVLGYASSDDGININERLINPIFYKNMGGQISGGLSLPKIPYGSGGGWNGGCEDPRLTLIDKTVYLLYTAFDGWGSLRMALATISLDDFLHKRFNWSQPVYISRQGEIHKNWVIFPEKINGKFAILHSVNPEVLVEYVDSLDELGRDKYINSFYGSVSKKKTADRWDSWVRGAGPPPIKTKYGWLLLYHAMSDKDPNRYKLGAMILDAKNPSKVLYRSNQALLEPDECYENEGWKRGVVYSCGAVVIEGQLFIYYGGADMVSCVAVADLDQLLEQIISNEKPVVKRIDRGSKKKTKK